LRSSQNCFLGIQANTSPLSYEELDGSKDLKCSDPELLAKEMVRLKEKKISRYLVVVVEPSARTWKQ